MKPVSQPEYLRLPSNYKLKVPSNHFIELLMNAMLPVTLHSQDNRQHMREYDA